MKTKSLTTLSILFMLILATAGTTFAQTAVAGVSKGETFDYNYNVLWSSNDPSATPPSECIEYNKTQTIQMKITEVAGTRISLQCIKHFKNGTQSIEAGYINIDTGAIEVPYGFLIISANLGANQKMYPSGGHATIKDNTMRTYPSGQRETNHYISEATSQGIYEKTEIYFDKLKGIAVDYSYETRETSDSYTTTIKEVLTNTNSDVWSIIPEFPAYIIPLILVAATASLLLVRGKKFSRKPTPI